jgi:5-methyltetrahydropteroyltriglutamate--homocysteine methyltransferase
MNRDKLKSLGIELPLLPTTTVGSLPKSETLITARNSFARGEISYSVLKNLELQMTEFWVRKQDEIGLDIIVDGEMYRGDMAAFFAETLKGFQTGGLVRSYGNRYYRKPVITDKIKWCGPITVDWWRYAQSLTKKPVKGMITGPYTIMDWSFNEYYTTRRAATLAIARELRKEVAAMVGAGVKIIQIDEPAISTRTEELDFAREAIHVITEGIQAYFVCHICYGNFTPVYRHMLSLSVDNLDLETSRRPKILEDYLAKNPFDKDISYGAIDVHKHETESILEIENTIRHALTMFQPDTIWIDPDCGLKTRTIEESIQKLTNMQMAVANIRQEVWH